MCHSAPKKLSEKKFQLLMYVLMVRHFNRFFFLSGVYDEAKETNNLKDEGKKH